MFPSQILPDNAFLLFQDVRVYSEEVELDSRDAQQDYKQFKESCESLANLMSEIQNLKANGAKEGVRCILKENTQTQHYSRLWSL